MFGTQDLLVGLVLVGFFFGAKRLPELARSLGESMTEFKKAVTGTESQAPAAPPAAALPATASRACPACSTPLEAGWSHCPRCGTVAPPSTPPAGAN